jgi:hypothetical protein
MNEHSFIRAVHQYLPSEIFRWKIHDTYAGGVPDAYYAGPASALFVEYKYLKSLPKRDSTELRTSLTPQQIHWLNTLHGHNQRVAVVIGAEKSAIVLLDKRWNVYISKSEFLRSAVGFSDVAQWIANVCSQSVKAQEECLPSPSPLLLPT